MYYQFVLTQLYLKNGSLSHGDDEDFIAKAIEDKASYHGRRHDTVLYTGQRVKKKNLLTIANYRLAQRGKKLRGSLPKSVPLDFGLEETFAL